MKKQAFRRVCRKCKDEFEVEGSRLIDYIIIPPQDFLCYKCKRELGYEPVEIKWNYGNIDGSSGTRIEHDIARKESKMVDK